MDTIIYQIKNTIEDGKSLKQAGEIIKAGGLVAFPTETVYGLGGDALNPDSSRKIYAAKGRPSDNPLIVHIANWEALTSIVAEIPEAAKKLADAFWPGPLTMIFRKSDKVPRETTGGLETVAVRMPSDPVALAFIEESGGYIAAPSANLSGKPSPTSAKYVAQDMDGRIEMIIDGGDVDIGLESTIVDLTEGKATILRPGYVTKEMLEQVLGQVEADVTMMEVAPGQAPKAPGMKYRHYAPKGDLAIVEGSSDQVVAYINEQTKLLEEQGKRVAVIGTDETKALYRAAIVKSVGSRKREETIAHGLYRVLREFDDLDVQYIFSESFDTAGMGQAIMNRLLKAAGHKVIQLGQNQLEKTKEKREMIAIGSDHGGFELKEQVIKHLQEKGLEVKDFGCYDKSSVDYPVYGKAVAKAVAEGICEKGIVICTTGIGISITANKFKGIRCALCADTLSAQLTRLHNDANVLAMGAGIVGPNLAMSIVDTFLETEFSGEERHQRRIDQIED